MKAPKRLLAVYKYLYFFFKHNKNNFKLSMSHVFWVLKSRGSSMFIHETNFTITQPAANQEPLQHWQKNMDKYAVLACVRVFLEFESSIRCQRPSNK